MTTSKNWSKTPRASPDRRQLLLVRKRRRWSERHLAAAARWCVRRFVTYLSQHERFNKTHIWFVIWSKVVHLQWSTAYVINLHLRYRGTDAYPVRHLCSYSCELLITRKLLRHTCIMARTGLLMVIVKKVYFYTFNILLNFETFRIVFFKVCGTWRHV